MRQNIRFFFGGGNATFSGNKDEASTVRPEARQSQRQSRGSPGLRAPAPCCGPMRMPRLREGFVRSAQPGARSGLVHVRLDRILQGLRLGAADAVHLLGALPEVEGRQGPHALRGQKQTVRVGIERLAIVRWLVGREAEEDSVASRGNAKG